MSEQEIYWVDGEIMVQLIRTISDWGEMSYWECVVLYDKKRYYLPGYITYSTNEAMSKVV